MGSTRHSVIIGMVFGAILVPCADVFADATPATAEIIQITATRGGYSDTFEMVFPVGSIIEDTFTWELDAPIMLSDQGTDLAYLEELGVTFNADPSVILGLDTTNSSATDEVYVNVKSARIVFGEITDAYARAWAQVSVTDKGGIAGIAYVDNAGTFPFDKLYQARYSTDPIVHTNDVFASLVSEFQTDFGQTVQERLPARNYSSLGTSVYMMEAEFEFILSAGDRANCLSNFEIVPEPTTLSILAFGGLFVLRRRRRTA